MINVKLLTILIIVSLIILNIKQTRDKFNGIHDIDINNEKYTSLLNKKDKCYLVEKKLANDGSGFYYDYSKTTCDLNDPRNLNHNLNDKRVFNNNINSLKKELGSCRKDTHECFDFFTKDKCDKYEKMKWNKLPCNMPIHYINKVEPYKIFNVSDIIIKQKQI